MTKWISRFLLSYQGQSCIKPVGSLVWKVWNILQYFQSLTQSTWIYMFATFYAASPRVYPRKKRKFCDKVFLWTAALFLFHRLRFHKDCSLWMFWVPPELCTCLKIIGSEKKPLRSTATYAPQPRGASKSHQLRGKRTNYGPPPVSWHLPIAAFDATNRRRVHFYFLLWTGQL